MRQLITLLLVAGLASACARSPQGPLFELIPPSQSGITFENVLDYDYDFNVYRYRNFYNGGGVALGDVNGDGLLDVFFTGNQRPNRLYLNNGGFSFKDVSEQANVQGTRAWSTGVSMADVNGDGRLDIYVCNSGIVEGDDKRNELYINRGDTTFVEMAATYGLDDNGLSTHASFFDYDRDGDLDVYLVNNSYRNIGSFDLEVNTRHIRHAAGGDRLFRNDNGLFVDVSDDAGIYGSEIGFGLGASIGDVNRDGWPDLYISNDFFERDYLYINNRNGTFSETLEKSMASTSAAAMGADIADLDGDGWLDIFVTDMLPASEVRLKTVSSFDSWERYRAYVRDDYFHQFTRNTLHLGRGLPPVVRPVAMFSESGRMLEVEASDWSWGALIADFDLDGQRDIFVANGIFRDLTNADYLVEIRQEATMEALTDENYVDWKTLIDMIPSEPVPNHMFAGRKDSPFADVTRGWNLAEPGFSNGSAYGDLDNDGDLDLVINNLEMPPFVYRNHAEDHFPSRHWLQIELKGQTPNTQAVGAQISAWLGDRLWYAEQQPVRGFQSSVDPVMHLGLGEGVRSLDSLIVRWPGGGATKLSNVNTKTRLTLAEPKAQSVASLELKAVGSPRLVPVEPETLGLVWEHIENSFSDFEQQPMLFHMRSTEGPAICAGDVNADGLEDLYLGGAKDQPGQVFVQSRNGQFASLPDAALTDDAISEDVDCVWFDADGDGDDDLYVASGGSEFPSSSSALIDRLYLNTDTGLTRSDNLLIASSKGFEPTSVVRVADVDEDGDPDLFTGSRLRPFAYGLPADGHLLINDGEGQFADRTLQLAPDLQDLGLITDAQWADFDGDQDLDLMVVGEWMPITLFGNDRGILSPMESGLETALGWWQSLIVVDLDGDQDLDFVAGNHGLNSRFKAPVDLWVSDFDRNGRTDQIFARTLDGLKYPWHLRHDLVEQLPQLVRSFPTYASYAGKTVNDLFAPEVLSQAVHLQATELRTVVGINNGIGQFTLEALPTEAQLAPTYGLAALDLDGATILLGGNLYEVKPEAGRYDASYGAAIMAKTLTAIPWHDSGFFVQGPVRSILSLKNRPLILVAINNDALRAFTYGE